MPQTASVHERLRRAFAPRLEALSDAGRAGLLLAAPSPTSSRSRRQHAISESTSRSAKERYSGSWKSSGRALEFRHPVVRSLVYGFSSIDDRRTVHRALAAALEAADEPDRRAWHLAAATDGPDEEIAAMLEETAGRAAGRGGQAGAARAIERAAELSESPEAAARRFHDASRATFWAGDAGGALELARRGLALADDPLLRADLLSQLVAISAWHG